MIFLKPKFMAISLAIFLSYLMLFAPTLALSATQQNQTINLETINDVKRLELAEFLLRSGQADKAIQAIIFKKFEQKQHIIIAESLLADSLFAIGKKAEAIVILRKLLAIDPSITIARYKLAQMLYATEDDLAAKHHFQILRNSVKGDEAQNIISQYIAQLDLRKKWFFNIGGNILPQSNINGGSSKDKYFCEDTASTPQGIAAWKNLLASFGLDCTAGIPISASDQAQSGLVYTGNITAGYRFKMTDNASWTIRSTAEYTHYPKATIADVITLALNTGPTIQLSNATKLNINGMASISISNKAISQKRYAISATFDHVFSPQILANFGSTITKTQNINNDDYSNLAIALNTSAQISIDNSSFMRLLGGVAHGEYKQLNLSYWQFSSGIGYYKEFTQGITIYSQFDIARKTKPLEAVTTYNFNAKLTKRDLSFLGFTPQLIYNYNRADSNINRNDTDAHSLSIGITRSF